MQLLYGHSFNHCTGISAYSGHDHLSDRKRERYPGQKNPCTRDDGKRGREAARVGERPDYSKLFGSWLYPRSSDGIALGVAMKTHQ